MGSFHLIEFKDALKRLLGSEKEGKQREDVVGFGGEKRVWELY